MKEIIVDVDVDGSVVIETKGFVGTDCLKATMELEKALGRTAKDDKKSEYFKQTQKLEVKR